MADLSDLIALHRWGEGKTAHLRQLTRQAIAAWTRGRLGDAGFFQAGGRLVGTHVYMAYQNYRGIGWESAAQTLDLNPNFDILHAEKNVSIAIPSDVTMDMGGEIDALKIGFVPVKSLTTYLKSDKQDLQIDFVTCLHRGGDTPVLIKALNAALQPLKFIEFLWRHLFKSRYSPSVEPQPSTPHRLKDTPCISCWCMAKGRKTCE